MTLGQDPNQFREGWNHPTWREKDGEDPRILGVGGAGEGVGSAGSLCEPDQEVSVDNLISSFTSGQDTQIPIFLFL